jgi:Carboxypeptidase regulatory-like domain
MRVSISRTELTILATSLITLLALALAPTWWGAAFGQGATLNSLASRTRELQGTVSVGNEAGERLPGASLNLISTFAGRTARSTVTNDQGEYKFTDLAAGVYTLHVTLNGFKEHSETVSISGVATTTKDIPLEVADVSATVTVVADDPTRLLPFHSIRTS